MALIANTWSRQDLPGVVETQADWTEAAGPMTVERGFYRNPSRPDEEILIDHTKTLQNKLGMEIRRDEEHWSYDRPGAPPTEYNRTTYSRAYLPGVGGYGLRKVEEEAIRYWTFTPLTDGQNLGRTRRLSAYVVYDIPVDPTQATDSDTQAAVAEAGMTAGAVKDRTVHSGKLWSEANHDGSTIPEPGQNQYAVWVPDVVVEHDLVEEEWDRWVVWTVRKNALRPGDVEWDGPRDIRKPNITYKLPVPVEPPTLEAATRGAGGVLCEVVGGGARIINTWAGNSVVHIRPTQYRLYRKRISEPDRTASGDLYDWWDTDPAAPAPRRILENTAVTDLNGTPTSALPGQTSYTEPHDPTPPPPEPVADFELVATLDNEQPDYEVGRAEFVDLDVVSGGVYEYYATALVNDEESTDSNHERVTYTGDEHHRYRLAVRRNAEPDDAAGASVQVDAIAPWDPELLDADFGETLTYDLPIAEVFGDLPSDPVTVAETVAEAQFSVTRTPPIELELRVLHPVLGLEYGQAVVPPAISWEAYGNGLHLSTTTQSDTWVLVGFSKWLERRPDGTWGEPQVDLTLAEYPR